MPKIHRVPESSADMQDDLDSFQDALAVLMDIEHEVAMGRGDCLDPAHHRIWSAAKEFLVQFRNRRKELP